MTKELLEQTLIENKWCVISVARVVGINESSVYKRIKKYGLKRPAEFIRGNWNRGKTHCKRGHEFTLESTFVNKFGYRVCKLCVEIMENKNE